MVSDPATTPAWHPALAYALTGSEIEGLARQLEPDLDQLTGELERHLPGGLAGLRRQVEQRRAREEPWPYAVPAALREGIGMAQFVAVRDQLVQILGLGPPNRVRAERAGPLTLPERRLLDEVPPHSVK